MEELFVYRACIDSTEIARGRSITALKKVLSLKRIREVGGYSSDGYIDRNDSEFHDGSGWTTVTHRCTERGNAGWHTHE